MKSLKKQCFRISLCKNFVRAFTLVELIVSVSIMILVLTITLSGRGEAILRLSVADAQMQTDLSLRQAQLQGSSVSSAQGIYGGAGIFFDRSTSTKMIRFRDTVDPAIPSSLGVGNGLYDMAGNGGEPKETLTLDRGNKYGRLCVSMSTSSFVCNSETNELGIPVINTLTISFTRPNQRANIYVNGATTTNYTSACVQIDSVKSPIIGYLKSVYIYKSGLIVKSSYACH